MSRPIKPIDWDRVEKMMWAGLSGAEIAGRFNMHHDTFYYRFKEQYNTSFASMALYDRETGNGLLREKQFNEAMTGNNHQLTKLCEERLGQGKKSEADGADQRNIVQQIQACKDMGFALDDGSAGGSSFSNEQSLSYQECGWKEDPVQDELGTTDPMGGAT